MMKKKKKELKKIRKNGYLKKKRKTLKKIYFLRKKEKSQKRKLNKEKLQIKRKKP